MFTEITIYDRNPRFLKKSMGLDGELRKGTASLPEEKSLQGFLAIKKSDMTHCNLIKSFSKSEM